MNEFASNLGKLADALDRLFTNIAIVLIIILAILIVIYSIFHPSWCKIILRVFSLLFGAISIFYFQHEVGLYAAGGFLLFAAIIAFISSFSKKKVA